MRENDRTTRHGATKRALRGGPGAALGAAALLWASACGERPVRGPVVTSPVTEPSGTEHANDEAPSATPTAAPSAEVDVSRDPRFAELLSMVDETVTRVSTLRELSVRAPVSRGILTREQILARMRVRVAQEYPPGEVLLEAEIPRRLGLIPEGLDYEATIMALLEEQVAGFYDPTERRLFIASWTPTSEQGVTLSHEITHALQDQHFDIGRFVRHVRGQGDAQSAAMAVVEGDATLTMLEDMLAQQGMSLRTAGDLSSIVRRMTSLASAGAGSARLRAAPRALREGMLFPYQEGFAMCSRTYQRGGFAAIDELLRTPPASTEQVLHDDKLRAHEPPVEIPARVPASVAGAYADAYQDVLGELSVRQVLQTQLDDTAAARGARGWGGDRAVLLVPREDVMQGAQPQRVRLDRSVLVWSLAFDPGAGEEPSDTNQRGRARRADASGPAGEGEAREFEALAGQVLMRRYPGATAAQVAPASVARETAPGVLSLVARAGRAVVWIERVPAAQAPRVACEALANVRAVLNDRGAAPRGC